MKNKCYIDFETRSLASVKLVGAYKYALDPSTRLVCMAYRLPGKGIELWVPGTAPFPETLAHHVNTGRTVEAHNAGFEYAIWNYCLRRREPLIPKLVLSQLECSAAQAAALALPRSLEKAALALELDVKKDMAGHRTMLKVSQPRKPTKNNPSVWHDDPEDLKKVYEYCINDVVVEEQISKNTFPLSEKEKRIWELTEEINERGIYCDVPLVTTAVEFLKRFETENLARFKQLTGGKVDTVKQIDKFKALLLDQYGVALETLDAKSVAEALKGDLPPVARELLTLRQLLAKSSVKKYDAMLKMACPDQRLRGTLMYHGASTGRYVGRIIQPQNYAKAKIKDVDNIYACLEMGDYDFFKTIFPDVFTALSSALRGMLKAAPGKELMAGDFSAIEARVLLWLAQDEKNLKVWREGNDPYKVMAADIFGVGVDAVTPEMRDMGKRAILGCGYSMGAEKFKKTCLDQGGVVITDEFSKRVIAAYRARHAAVVQLWHSVEAACRKAIQNKGHVFTVGVLKFTVRAGYLFIKLPSGRKLAYKSPALKTSMTKWGPREEIRYMAEHPQIKKWLSEATYSGKIVENITQAVARDVMCDAMLRLNDNHFYPIMTVHDEIVCEVRRGERELSKFESLMATPPEWAPDLPLAVSAWSGERYRK